VVAVALLSLGGPAAQPAYACSCAAATDEAAFERSDAVFLGEVVDYESPPQREVSSSADLATWTFAVSETYKGDVAATQEIVSEWSGESCGLEIPQHGEFLVFATRQSSQGQVGEKQFYAGLCGGTRPIEGGPLAVASAPAQATTAAPPQSPSELPRGALGEAAPGRTDDATPGRTDAAIDVPMALAALGAMLGLVGLAAFGLHRRARC